MPPRMVARPSTSRSGSANGSGLISAAFITPNMATFAAMPTARVSTTTVANPGLLASLRSAWRRSEAMVDMANPVGFGSGRELPVSVPAAS